MRKSARDLLSVLFVDSQHEDAIEGALEEGAAKKPKPAKELEDLGGPQVRVEKLEERKPGLLKILTDLGIVSAKDRLKVEANQYRLVSDSPAAHLADATVLFDMSKIDPLVDAGFIALDTDAPREGGVFSVLIVAVDQSAPDPEIDDFLEALSAEEGRGEPPVINEAAARKLVDSLLAVELEESPWWVAKFDPDTGRWAGRFIKKSATLETDADDFEALSTSDPYQAKTFSSSRSALMFALNLNMSAVEAVTLASVA